MAFERKKLNPKTGKYDKPTGRFYSDFRERDSHGNPTGGRVRKLLVGCKNLREAKEAERRLIQSRQAPREEKPVEMTFHEFVENHYRPFAEFKRKNFSYVRTILNRLEDFFGDIPLKSISQFTVVNYIKHRLTQKTERGGAPKNSSINTEVFSILSAVLEKAVGARQMEVNPCHGLKALAKQPPACPRLEDESGLLKACAEGPGYLAPAVLTFLGTGLRRMELLRLKWADVDFARSLLFLRDTKWEEDPRKSEGLPFGSRVREALLSLPKRGEFVFTLDDGDPVPPTTFYEAYRAACERAGIAFGIHSLRHEYGSRLGDMNTSPYRIARLMGHANVKMSMRYVHAKADDLHALAEAVSSDSGHSAVTREKVIDRIRA